MSRTIDSIDIRQLSMDLAQIIMGNLDDRNIGLDSLDSESRLEIAEDIEDMIHDTLERMND